MRIVAYIQDHNGPTYHRISLPLALMQDVDSCVTNDPAGDFSERKGFEAGCDVFMWNRVLPDRLWAKLPELKERYGFRTCCDLDDHWLLDEHHPLYQNYIETEFARRQIEHIRAADFVIVTHNRLAAAVAEFNPNVEVVENAIPKTGQFDIDRDPSEVVRLFWQGSDTHQEDIAILQQPLRGLGPLSGMFKMVMAGVAEDSEIWYRMASQFTAGFKTQYKLIVGEGVLDYYKFYKEADICLAPLVRSRFNSHKSNLKILEAANLRLPVVASMVDPYLDMPVAYCQKGRDWVRHITDLVKSSRKRKEAGEELAVFCEEHYNFCNINRKRKEIFEYEAAKA